MKDCEQIFGGGYSPHGKYRRYVTANVIGKRRWKLRFSIVTTL